MDGARVDGDGAESALEGVDGEAATALSRLMYWSMSKGAMVGEVSCDDDSVFREVMMAGRGGSVRKLGCWAAKSRPGLPSLR